MRGVVTRKRAVVLVVGAAVVAGAIVFLPSDEADGVARAIDIAENPSRFESSPEAGDSLAVIAGVLMDDSRRCIERRSSEHPACVARSEAAAYAQTLAVVAVTCTGPGVFDVRSRLLEYLRAVERVGDDPAAERPRVPNVPSC